MAAVVEAVEHLLEVVGEHGRAQGDALLPLGRELEVEGRVLIPLLDSTPDVTSAQGEEVIAVNLAGRDFLAFFLKSAVCAPQSRTATRGEGWAWCVRGCRAHHATLRGGGCLEEGFLTSR